MKTNLAHKTVEIASPYRPEADLVRHALIERGLETPLLPHQFERDEKYSRIRASFAEIARMLGLDLSDDSLCETPRRIAGVYERLLGPACRKKHHVRCNDQSQSVVLAGGSRRRRVCARLAAEKHPPLAQVRQTGGARGTA